MKRPAELVRALALSPEIASALVIVLAATHWPTVVLRLGGLVHVDRLDGWALTLVAAPFAILIAGYSLGTAVLRPERGREALAAWSDYWRLRMRVYIALGWMCFGALGWIIGWILVQMGALRYGITLALAAVAAAVTALFTVALARHGVQDALDLTT